MQIISLINILCLRQQHWKGQEMNLQRKRWLNRYVLCISLKYFGNFNLRILYTRNRRYVEWICTLWKLLNLIVFLSNLGICSDAKKAECVSNWRHCKDELCGDCIFEVNGECFGKLWNKSIQFFVQYFSCWKYNLDFVGYVIFCPR